MKLAALLLPTQISLGRVNNGFILTWANQMATVGGEI